MQINFFKYEGTGNDFVIIDNRSLKFEKTNRDLITRICNPKKGVGADGLILLENDKDLNFKMVYYNADGSESGFCGNGSRCITHLAKYLKIIDRDAKFKAIDGIHESKIINGIVSVKMNDLPMNRIINYDDERKTTFIDSGSPHLIMLCSNIDKINVVKIAGEVKSKFPQFEQGFNINFCEIDKEKIKLRTYERGVEDETLSCGTGAVATAIFLNYHNLLSNKKIDILMKGGQLTVEVTQSNEIYSNIWLSGNVNSVFSGTYNLT